MFERRHGSKAGRIDEILRRLQESQQAHQERQVPFTKDRYLPGYPQRLSVLLKLRLEVGILANRDR